MWKIPFITKKNFQLNIKNTVIAYYDAIKSFDLIKKVRL